MVEPEIQTTSIHVDEHENEVMEFGEADSLSTNENKQMDGEMEETNEEDGDDATSSEIPLELNEELQAGYKILSDLMSHAKRAANWPFMESVEVSAPDLFEVYKQRIEKPMWLKLMKKKFEEHQYTTITEFVSDFRLMLENCYRFNGPDHYISKRAQKMETMLEQKLALLPRDFREKTTIDATTEQKTEGGSGGFGLRRRPKSHVLHDSTYLLNQLREAEYQKKREYRIRQIMARRAEREALAQEIMDWEDKVLFEGKKDQMMAMWEIPQIGLFLFLCQGQLNIGEVMHFELERCFMMARESSTMQLIMTSLLSTPFQRLKLDKKNLMPYKVWEQKLRVKLQTWYKVYTDTDMDLEKTCFKLGLDEQFFDIMGTKNPLERKRYHELSFYRKVWIMKSLCDNCLHTQDSLRETIEVQPYEDQREYLLGTDNSGQRYIHFPQFCGADVRVYKQAPFKYPKIEIKPDPFDNKRKFPFVYKPPPLKKVKLKKKKRHRASPSKPASENVSPMSSPLRQRPSRLRQAPKAVVPLQMLDEAYVTESSTSSESETEELSAVDDQEPGQSSSADVPKAGTQCLDSEPDQQLDDQSVDRLSSGSDATLPYCDNSDSNSNVSSREPSRDSSPYPSCSDLNLRFSSHIDRSSDVSQESSPCQSPADFAPRRSLRLDRYSDTSRDASPLIFDSDFGLRRSSRNRARLKNIPPSKAARDLSTFLFDENSASNSIALGENSLSGMGTSLFKDALTSRRSSKSSDLMEDSIDCDIHVNKLFANSKTSDSPSDFSASFHGVLDKTDQDDAISNISVNDDDKAETGVTDENITEGNNNKNICNEDDNVNNNNINISLKSFQEPVFEGEKSPIETLEPNEENSCSAADIDNTLEAESCDFNEEKETNVESSDGVSYTGKVSQDMVENFRDKFSDIQIADMLQSEEIVSNKVADKRDPSDGGDVDIPDTNTDKNSDEISENMCNDTNDDLTGTENCEEMEEGERRKSIDTEDREETMDIKTAENVMVNSEKTEMKIEPVLEVNENKTELDTDNESVGDTDVESKIGINIKVEPTAEIIEEMNNDFKPKIEENQLNGISQIKEEFSSSAEVKTDDDSQKIGTEEGKFNMKEEMEESVIDSVKPEIKEEIEPAEKDVGSELEKQEESDEEEEEEEKVPDSRQFEMVADTVEEVRKLAEQFAEPEPIVIRRGKKEQIQKPAPRKKNIVILHERLQFLLKELEPWESKLQQATKRARLRLRKEMEDYILKPPEEKTEDWKSSDEETESGESDEEDNNEAEDDSKNKQKLTDDKTSASNSRCSTPVKPPEEIDEIDISHRGRLRKRRIIPNNVEDQLAVKKPKPVKSESSQSTPTTNQPVIVQSGKTQLVDYADIIRQLKNTGGNTPILIKTTQGGRTVLTSVLPVNANSNSSSNTTTTQALQTIRIVSPSSVAQQTATVTVQPQALRIAVPSTGFLPATSKALQHPTIQNLLSGTVAGSKLLPKTSTSTSVTATENVDATGQPSVVLAPTPEKSNAQKVVPPNQTTPQKVVPSPVTTPRKIAPHTTASNASGKPKAKYYAANASTLPINVVEQLIATRGAKLSQGAYNQSILLIPMENDGQTRNVVSSAPVTPVKSQPSPSTTPDSGKSMNSENTQTPGPSTSATKTSPNALILPKPQTSPVLSLGQGIPGLQIQQGFAGLQRPQAFLQPAIVDGLNVTRLVPMGISPKSPTRYPTNETVKTLLEKRKPPEEKETFILEKRKLPAVTKISNSVGNIQSNSLSEMRISAAGSFVPHMSPVKTDQNLARINSEVGLVKGLSVTNVASQPVVVPLDSVKKEALVSAVKAQQCVITSISAAKLNTLLLQTSAAGAKSIPSLIKLPSKAALDSAVKAVVTSVNVTLPTVNIKVPSPTSLPSIGPRRNVTKTIQTMKSPIPVAPKVVTQSSGGQTTLSFADTHTASSSPMLTVSSTVQGSSTSCNVLSVNQSQTVTGSQDQDGKRVVTRLAPQLVLTPKGVMQMGFVNQGHLAGTTPSLPSVNPIAVPSTVQSGGNQTILIQNSAGQYQLIQQTSPVLQQTGQGTSLQQLASQSVAQSQGQGQNLLQTVKPVVALNASGNPIILPTVKSNTQVAPSSSPPSIVLHKSTYYTQKPTTSTVNSVGLIGTPSVTGNIDLKSPSPGFVFQQPSSGVLHPQTPIVTQSGMISPLLGIQQGLVLQSGVQLASPLVNPVGLNLLHPGVQALQNASSLQASGTPNLNLLQKTGTAGAQMLNINPLLLNAALTTTSAGVLRQQLNSQLTMASGIQPSANLGTSLARMGVNTVVKPSTLGIQQQTKQQPLTVAVAQTAVGVTQNGASLVSPMSQMIQMQGSPLVIPGVGGATNQQLNLIGQLAARPNPAQKQLVFQYPSVSQAVTNVSSQLTQTVASVSTKQSVNDQVMATAPLAKLQAPLKRQVKLVYSSAGQTVAKNDNLINTVSINQVTVGQKTGSAQQKLLLFSIGGQLVTGQGVPVSLSDGVLKVVPHGKVKINNQTLTPDQIKQTLAKINEAAAMTLNPASQQQTQTQQTGTNAVVDQGKVIPVKIVKDSKNSAGPSLASVDHSYLNTVSNKLKIVTSLVNGNDNVVSQTQSGGSDPTILVSPHIQTGLQVVNSDSMKVKQGQDVQPVGQSNEQQYGLKPMGYSSGYIVRQRTSNQEEVDEKPGFANQNFDIGKLVVDKETKRFVIKAPVKNDLNGGGDASNNLYNHNADVKIKPEGVAEEDDENEDDKLVIDDGVSDKEAALNLLTLANQAPAPLVVKMENNETHNAKS